MVFQVVGFSGVYASRLLRSEAESRPSDTISLPYTVRSIYENIKFPRRKVLLRNAAERRAGPRLDASSKGGGGESRYGT